MKTKRLLSLCLLLTAALALRAQDIIVLKNDVINDAKVLEVSPGEVRYRRNSLPDGPVFAEKRSDVMFIKFQSGEVQHFRSTSGMAGHASWSSSAYEGGKLLCHDFSFYVGNGWGLGYQLRREFNPYLAWNIAGISFLSRFQSPKNIGLINFRLLGARIHAPAYSGIRWFAGLDLGYSFGYEKNEYSFQTQYEDFIRKTTHHYDKHHFFGLDVSVGVQFHRNMAVSCNLNYVTGGGVGMKDYMARLSYIF